MASGSDVRAGGAFVEFFSKGDKAVQATLKDLEGRMKNMAKSVMLAGAGIAMLGASITTPMLAGLAVASEWSGGIVSAARRTGLGFQELQTLSFGLSLDLDEMAGATRKMNSFLNEAAHGSAQANMQLEELGVSVEELMRLSEGDRIRRLADALSGVGDAGHRGALQTAVFGRNAMGMNVSGGAAGLAQREQRGQRFTMSDADIALMREYNAAQKELGLATKALWASVGAAAAGPMKDFFVLITDLILKAKDWTQANRPLLEIIFRVADLAVTAGAAIGLLGSGIYGAAYAFRFAAGAAAIVSTAISAVWGFCMFAASGFGILSLASYAWAAVTTISSGVATAAIWAYNLAIGLAMSGFGILTIATWAWGIASAAASGIAVAAIWSWGIASVAASWIATAAMAVYKGALLLVTIGMVVLNAKTYLLAAGNAILAGTMAAVKVVTVLAAAAMTLFAGSTVPAAIGTTIATAGINLLIAALGLLAVVILASPFLILGSAIWSALKGLTSFGSLASGLVTAAGGVGGAFATAASTVAGAFSSAWTRTTEGFAAIWPTVVANATTAWGGIMDAFAIGDWRLLWDILTTTVLLTWEQIRQPMERMWNGWKDAFADTFSSIVLSIKVAFLECWIFLRRGWRDVVRDAYLAWRHMRDAVADWLHPIPLSAAARREREANNVLEADRVSNDGGAIWQLNRDILNLQNQARNQQEELERTRAERDAAVRAGDEAEIARLTAEVNGMAERAQWMREIAEARRRMAMNGAREGADQIMTQARNSGTFSAQAASGFAGGSPMDRLQRVSEEQRDLLRLIRDAILANGGILPAMG